MSSNDLSSYLDCNFQTANEASSDNNAANAETAAHSRQTSGSGCCLNTNYQVNSDHPFVGRIKSQKLVNSDNEESTDDDEKMIKSRGLDILDVAELCIEIDKSEKCNQYAAGTVANMINPNEIDNSAAKFEDQQTTTTTCGSGKDKQLPSLVDRKRALWMRQSQLNRIPQGLKFSSANCKFETIESVDDACDNDDSDPNRMASESQSNTDNSSNDDHPIDTMTEKANEQQEDEVKSIEIRVEQYNSLDIETVDDSCKFAINEDENESCCSRIITEKRRQSIWTLTDDDYDLGGVGLRNENIIQHIESKISPANPICQTECTSASSIDLTNYQLTNLQDIVATTVSQSDTSTLINNKTMIGKTTFTRSTCGSLSDYSHQLHSLDRKMVLTSALSSNCGHSDSRLKQWKRANKVITHIHENPFNMHLDYLERFDSELRGMAKIRNDVDGISKCAEYQKINPSNDAKANMECEGGKEIQDEKISCSVNNAAPLLRQTGDPRQQTDSLNNCASHLTHIYRRNQNVMDNNNEFRALLYNIICCLLVQDEQTLSSPSVSKMLDVIRAHLDSVTRVYLSASRSAGPKYPLSSSMQNAYSDNLSSSAISFNSSTAFDESGSGSCGEFDGRRNSSSAISTTSATSSANDCYPNHCKQSSIKQMLDESCDQQTIDQSSVESISVTNSAIKDIPRDIGDARQQKQQFKSEKPIDFRRISSVSYNDEHLLNDLCDNYHCDTSGRSGSLSIEGSAARSNGDRFVTDSPWGYQELASERWSSRQQYHTSSSSLEQQQTATNNGNDTTNDSGNGTMFDYHTGSDIAMQSRSTSSYRSNNEESKRPRSSASMNSNDSRLKQQTGAKHGAHPSSGAKYRPEQQPSYMSTDEYLSNLTSICDDESSSVIIGVNCGLQLHDYQNNSNIIAMTPKHIKGEQSIDSKNSIDVASRKAELEWTLNKLINLELKHTWLTSNDTLRRAIRKIGVPHEIRGKVWLILIEQMIGTKYNVAQLLDDANKTIKLSEDDANKSQSATSGNFNGDEEIQSILKQIDLDVNRTMPNHKLFYDGAEGGIRLRRILVAYSVHINRDIAYCQGFNFIVALLLTVFDGDEEKALRGFVCIVDHIFPSKYYFDHYLTGARADQFLLADFICDQLIKNPTIAERKMVEGVTSSITLNWFISLFHGAVPTLTRLTILDHFMLEGVKALFRFTMAILYLAFQVTPPSSCEVFTTIRNTARDMYDIKLLLSIVDQIKLPKDSYFAIRRSFYMVQSSFNSDQFYMQTLANDAKRNLNPNKPLSVQQLPDTKAPALSLITDASPFSLSSPFTLSTNNHYTNSSRGYKFRQSNNKYNTFTIKNSICTDAINRSRFITSSDRTKVCIQSIGKLGRSHIKVMDVNVKSNERSLMSPLRNCLVIGITNCGKNLIIARQSSRRNFKSFQEQDLNFHIHELSNEIFDGYYLEDSQLVLILTHQGEVFRIDTTKCFADIQDLSTETLMLRDTQSIAEHEKIKLRLTSLDCLTNLLWIYVECEDTQANNLMMLQQNLNPLTRERHLPINESGVCNQFNNKKGTQPINFGPRPRFKHNNPFSTLHDNDLDPHQGSELHHHHQQQSVRSNFQRKIILIDIISFDIFSAFTVHPSFGDLINLRTSLLAFCQLANPMSNQFSSRIIQIGPTGRYEQLLSFSDVVDYLVNVPESYKNKFNETNNQRQRHDQNCDSSSDKNNRAIPSQRYSTLRRLLTHSKSLNNENNLAHIDQVHSQPSSLVNPKTLLINQQCTEGNNGHIKAGAGKRHDGTLARYYRSLIRSHSTIAPLINNNDNDKEEREGECSDNDTTTSRDHSNSQKSINRKSQSSNMIRDNTLRSIIESSLGDFSGLNENSYLPVNMTFIFRNGKIALFEFTESYAIHTREAQLDRYDYSKVIDVSKRGEVFVVTIMTVFDKIIKVVI